MIYDSFDFRKAVRLNQRRNENEKVNPMRTKQEKTKWRIIDRWASVKGKNIYIFEKILDRFKIGSIESSLTRSFALMRTKPYYRHKADRVRSQVFAYFPFILNRINLKLGIIRAV